MHNAVEERGEKKVKKHWKFKTIDRWRKTELGWLTNLIWTRIRSQLTFAAEDELFSSPSTRPTQLSGPPPEAVARMVLATEVLLVESSCHVTFLAEAWMRDRENMACFDCVACRDDSNQKNG